MIYKNEITSIDEISFFFILNIKFFNLILLGMSSKLFYQ